MDAAEDLPGLIDVISSQIISNNCVLVSKGNNIYIIYIIYIYNIILYMCVCCACVCVCAKMAMEKERERERIVYAGLCEIQRSSATDLRQCFRSLNSSVMFMVTLRFIMIYAF